MDLNQITLPCTDYDESVAFYSGLGLTLIVDSPPRYARFETSSGTTLSIHECSAAQASSGTVVYFRSIGTRRMAKSICKSIDRGVISSF